MGLIHSGEAWIVSILGWVWLTIQEVWGFNLLSAVVFYGMLLLSTCNLALQAFLPNSRAPRAAYFGTVLAFSISTFANILDTIPTNPAFGFESFRAPGNNTGCSYSKIQQAFLFNSSPVYLVPAGTIMGFLIIHLMIAGANMLDADNRSVWSGPSWGLALTAFMSFRFFTVFEGSLKASLENQVFYYVQLFSEPVMELSALFLLTFEAALFLSGIEGVYLPQLGQRKFTRFFSMGFVALFSIGSCVTLAARGMLTVPTLIALLAPLLPAVVGTIEAARQQPGEITMDAPSAPPKEQVMASSMSGRSVYNRPMSQAAKANRYYIPVPVEMIAEKNKGI
jgi:hypothetical protein